MQANEKGKQVSGRVDTLAHKISDAALPHPPPSAGAVVAPVMCGEEAAAAAAAAAKKACASVVSQDHTYCHIIIHSVTSS